MINPHFAPPQKKIVRHPLRMDASLKWTRSQFGRLSLDVDVLIEKFMRRENDLLTSDNYVRSERLGC